MIIIFSVRFYSGCLYQITIQLIISVIVLNLSKRPFRSPIPRGIRYLLLGLPGRCLGLSDPIHVMYKMKDKFFLNLFLAKI